MKIEKGQWVRTHDGIIGKVHDISDCDIENQNKRIICYDIKNLTGRIISFDNIKKSSFDIIDLIEVNDIVNGYRVEDINNKTLKIDINYGLPNEDIKYVLTHEQIKKYTVEVE